MDASLLAGPGAVVGGALLGATRAGFGGGFGGAVEVTGASGNAGVLGTNDGGELSGVAEAGARTGTALPGSTSMNPTSTTPFATTTAANKAARMKRFIESPHANYVDQMRGRLGCTSGHDRAAPFISAQ